MKQLKTLEELLEEYEYHSDDRGYVFPQLNHYYINPSMYKYFGKQYPDDAFNKTSNGYRSNGKYKMGKWFYKNECFVEPDFITLEEFQI